MAVHGFGRADRYLVGPVSEYLFYCLRLHNIIGGSRRAMGVDIIDIPDSEPGFIQGQEHCAGLAFDGRRCDMMRVSRGAIAGNLGIYSGAALLRTFHLFQHKHSRAFAYNKA